MGAGGRAKGGGDRGGGGRGEGGKKREEEEISGNEDNL